MSMTPEDQRKAVEALELVMKLVKGLNVSFTCNACDNYNSGHCKHFDEIVPEEHRLKGCDNFSDPIPFANPYKGMENLL